MGQFERFLTVWVFVCIVMHVAGAILSGDASLSGQVADRLMAVPIDSHRTTLIYSISG